VSAAGAAVADAPATVPARACPAPPRLQPPPADALDVRTFGAIGDGRADDTAALRRALGALAPGQWLVFPPGTYRHAARLVIDTPGVTLDGRGATLHATNPADQALLIQADRVRVQGFTLTAVTDRRRDAPWESRIAVWRHGRGLPALQQVEIRDNRIVEAGPPGSALANSSSSAAIFVHHAHHFVVERNLVRRSLSDGIHVTGASRHGRVLGNTVRESGDDMVGIVSYLDDGEPVRDVLVADNDVAGQYWGRGISVVGGEDVTFEANAIDATAHAAAIYIARETSFRTFGVRNVRVLRNRITRVQTAAPAYTVLPPWQRARRTGHAAIELVVQDAYRLPAGSAAAVREVAVEDNDVDTTAADGIRVGLNVDAVRLRDNRLHHIGGRPVEVLARMPTLHCASSVHPACGLQDVRITGARQSCLGPAGR
jgi:hypothetical protein